MSRATYLSERELHTTIDELRGANCPVDVIHVDAWLAGNVFREFTCSWKIDRGRFPQGWTDRIRDRGVRVSMWLNPFVLEGSRLAQQLYAEGLLLLDAAGDPVTTSDRANRQIIDVTHPEAVRWWQDSIRRLLDEERPDALKLDFGEEIPPHALAHDGRTGLALRNSYATAYQDITAQAAPGVPLFSRSGGLGAQRHPCHWVGDTPATWDAMAGALAACQSLALSGFGLVASDAGGFWTPGGGAIPAELLDGSTTARFTADVDPELFGRWGQWAAFSPVTRFHGVGLREPTAYPSPWRDAVIAALQVRRRFVPYLVEEYDHARALGQPLLRPMVLDHPDAPREADSQYLLGRDLLVAPVLRPGGRVRVWFPDTEWVPLLGAPRPVAPGLTEIRVAPEEFPIYARPHLAASLDSAR